VASSKAFIQDGLYVAGMLGKWDAGKIQAAAELRREQKAGAARKIDKYGLRTRTTSGHGRRSTGASFNSGA